jgi:hypothetical protein
MKIAIIADTHDNLRAVRYLVDFFNNNGVDFIIHAGDFVSPFVIEELGKLNGRLIGVFGNNDGDREALLKQAENFDLEIHTPPYQFEIGGRNFLLSHKPEDLPETIDGVVDVIISGHTHEAKNRKTENHLEINPGEAGGWLSSTTHSIILDTDDLSMEIYMVPAP